MVSSFGGALQVIGVRAVINDLNKFLNDGKRVQRQTEEIDRANQKLEASSFKAATALKARDRGISSSKITQFEKEEASALDKLNVARVKSTQILENLRKQEQLVTDAKHKAAEADHALAQRTTAAARAGLLGQDPPNVTKARKASENAAKELKKAEETLDKLRKQEKPSIEAVDKAESKLALTRKSIAARAAEEKLKLEQAVTKAEQEQARSKAALEKAEANLAKGRFAGARSLALGGAIVGAFATGGVISAALSAGTKFEDALTKIDNLTNLTTEDTRLLGEEIKRLTETAPKTADDLGAAAYFIASRGGLTLKDTIDILTISMNTAVAGFSTTEEVAKSVTGVVQAYGKQNISAAQAADILFAAVKAGGAEFNDFATQIGPVLPIARNLGIGFDQVAASMATLTNIGISASESATALRAVMVQIFSPSKQFADLLESAGTNVATFRQEVREKGLITSLQGLVDTFGGNVQVLDKLFPEVRGLTGAFTLLRDKSSEVTRIQGEVSRSAGIVADSFERTKATTTAQYQILKNQLIKAFIELGTSILPEVNNVLRDLTKIISDNKEGIKTFITEGLKLLISTIKLAVGFVGALVGVFSLIVSNKDATRVALATIGTGLVWALPGGPYIKGLTAIVGLLGAIGALSQKSIRQVAVEEGIKRLQERVNAGERAVQKRINEGATNAQVASQQAEIAKYREEIAKLTKELEGMGNAAETTVKVVGEFGEITLPKIEAEFGDFDLGEAEKKFKNFVDILEDGIISFAEATKPGWDGLIKGWDGVTAGGIEAHEALRRELERTNEFAFNFQKTLAKVAVAFQHSERAAQQLVLELAREALAKAQSAASAVLGRPTQEQAGLQLQTARIELFNLQREQAIRPQLEAAQQHRENIEEAFNEQLERLQDQRESLSDRFEAEEDALDERLDNLRERIDAEKERLAEEKEANRERANVLKDEIDAREEFNNELKRQYEDTLRANDRANQIRDRETQDAIEALNKQKDFLQKRQDLAISPSQKLAIQKHIDAIDAEIESRRHGAEAADRIQEDQEFLLREEQIARDREEEDRKEALERQIDAIDKEIEAREKEIESREKAMDREVKALEKEIEARKKANDREVKTIEDRIEQLQDTHNGQIKSIEGIIKNYEGQIEQGTKLAQHFEDQSALLEAQKAIWEAEIQLADKTLFTNEELKNKTGELIRMIEFESTWVRHLSNQLQTDLVPELQEAKNLFDILGFATHVLTEQSFRQNFIPAVNTAAIHANLLAQAAAAAAEKLDDVSRSAGAAASAVGSGGGSRGASAGAGGGGSNRISPPGFSGGAGLQSPVGPDALSYYRDLIAQYFPPSAVADAMKVMAFESSGNSAAHNYNPATGDDSYGLFQINLNYHPLTPEQARDPQTNIAYAAKLWREAGNSWRRDWVAASEKYGLAEHGAIVRRPTVMMLGEHNKQEIVLPITDIARSRELMASVSPTIRAAILGGVPRGGDIYYNFDNITLPNVARAEQFIPALEAHLGRQLRFKKRGA